MKTRVFTRNYQLPDRKVLGEVNAETASSDPALCHLRVPLNNWRIQKLIICTEKSRFHECGTVPLNDRLATTLSSTGTAFSIIIAPVNQPTAMPFVYTSLLQISLSPEQAQIHKVYT